MMEAVVRTKPEPAPRVAGFTSPPTGCKASAGERVDWLFRRQAGVEHPLKAALLEYRGVRRDGHAG